MASILTINLMGGLGNQLFQIATAYAYAKKYGLCLVFPKTWNNRYDRPPIWDTYFKQHPFRLIDVANGAPWIEIKEAEFAYTPLPLSPDMPFLKLNGYFQSSRYFQDDASEIRALLQVPSSSLGAAAAVLESQGVVEPKGWIGAHVRRGDYLVNPDVVAFHEVTTVAYFNGARSEIERRLGEKRGVCWITEDPDWVYKTVYREGDKVFRNTTEIDFALLASFEHLILSNSSFSWWAAWLNPYQYSERVICAPSRWFGPSGPKVYSTIYEDDWTLIDPTSGQIATHV